MSIRVVFTLSALPLFAASHGAFAAGTFEDLWLTRIKPPPYSGLASEFDDTIASDGKRLHPYRDLVCAHMLEPLGQRLRRFWPRREIDLTPPTSKAIGCDGMCNVSLERVAP